MAGLILARCSPSTGYGINDDSFDTQSIEEGLMDKTPKAFIDCGMVSSSGLSPKHITSSMKKGSAKNTQLHQQFMGYVGISPSSQYTAHVNTNSMWEDIRLFAKDEIELFRDGTFRARKSGGLDTDPMEGIKIENGGRKQRQRVVADDELWTRVDWDWHPFGRRLVHKM
jgi:hypothetical protein